MKNFINSSNKEYILRQKLYKFSCPKSSLDEINNFLKKFDWDKVNRREKSHKDLTQGKSFIPENLSLSKLKELKKIHLWINKCFNEVRKDLLYDDKFIPKLKITQSWLNYSIKGESHHVHYHKLSILSGILYLSEPASTQFFFPSIYSLPEIISSKSDSQRVVKENFNGSYGDLIIFPSTLKHWVGPNMYEKPRITMSMNTWFYGSIGKASNLVYIDKSI